MRKLLGLALAMVMIAGIAVSADEIKRVAVTVGSLGNPGFVVMGEGVTQAVREKYPNAQVTVVSGDYDLSKQS
jgi:ABC-type sugar transport system, periplasmic component